MKVRRSRIVVIEDDTIHLSFLSKLLDSRGYDIDEADEGLSGIQKIFNNKPDLILCDLNMPDMSGHEILKEVRLQPDTRLIPFVFITMNAMPEEIREGMNLGADDFISAPYRNEDLINTIESRLRKRNKEIELFNAEQNLFRQRIISMLPHEFNTPLVGILGGISMLWEQYDDLEDSERKTLLEIAYNMTTRLERMSRNYLTYLKIEVSTGDIKMFDQLTLGETNSTKDFIEEIARNEFKLMKRQDDAEINVNIDTCTVFISNENIKLLISEALNNALRYSDKGTKVLFSAETSDSYLILKIKDFGRGMSEAQISQIGAFVQFERIFYEQQGAGLGLVLVQKITEMNKGKFEIRSVLNEGTEVTIYLPMKKI